MWKWLVSQAVRFLHLTSTESRVFNTRAIGNVTLDPLPAHAWANSASPVTVCPPTWSHKWGDLTFSTPMRVHPAQRALTQEDLGTRQGAHGNRLPQHCTREREPAPRPVARGLGTLLAPAWCCCPEEIFCQSVNLEWLSNVFDPWQQRLAEYILCYEQPLPLWGSGACVCRWEVNNDLIDWLVGWFTDYSKRRMKLCTYQIWTGYLRQIAAYWNWALNVMYCKSRHKWMCIVSCSCLPPVTLDCTILHYVLDDINIILWCAYSSCVLLI